MKFYPYSKIKTENLSTLLFTARFLGVLGYLFSLFTVLLWVSSFFLGPRTFAGDPNGPIISATWSGARGIAWYLSLGTISSALFFFVVSGLCAAVVSCEYKYTQVQNAI